MKKLLYLFLFLPFAGICQTLLPITNNMNISSNSNIKFIPGNYVFTDTGLDGIIRISGVSNVILDGDSCTVNGTNYTGYCIRITNSHNIIIRNFDSVFQFNYAVYIMNSDHITINGNNFCRNKTDSAGWIDVWADYQQALGGGVMMYQSRAADIFNNVMNLQNDGVALYHCDSIRVHNNAFDWNTSYGIRMFWTDSCLIYQNTASHVNRPLTDPSDCAALLMIISNNNRVENNDLSWSGDGVFLGQYQHSGTPNNNYFAYNECSYSPHNAIEATFADGNVYKHNLCNYSDYGLWLGYSFNTIADSNEINGNYNSGIAVDRGFNNSFTANTFKDNPIAVELWEGSPITGYESQTSHDYFIRNNRIEGNTVGISLKSTENSRITGNDLLYNQAQAVNIEGTSTGDTITGNDFRMTTVYHIRNMSTSNIYAPGNHFEPNDSLLTEDHIYDKKDVPSRGVVQWFPALPGPPAVMQNNPPCDMAESSSLWYAYPEIGYPGPRITDTLLFDSTEKVVGAASVKLITGRGWDVALNYRPALDSASAWALTDQDTLYFWVRTIKQPQFGFQYFHIRVGDDKGNYYRYTAPTYLLNNANETWMRYKMPLAGGGQFTRSMTGTMTLDAVNYVEFHADTWDYGYTLWLDGVQFAPCDPVTSAENNLQHQERLMIYPNPAHQKVTVNYPSEIKGEVTIRILDLAGREMRLIHPTSNISEIPLQGLSGGIYLISVSSGDEVLIGKVVVE